MNQINLLDRARAYLDLNGFPMADMDMYFPNEYDWDYGGIVLRSHQDFALVIYVINPSCAHNSTEIALKQNQGALLEPILDALMFAIKHGKSPDDR